MGQAGSSLISWNAWDRQRLDWTAPGISFNPAARNANNTSEVNGDLDASNSTHAGIYYLRDFVTTGDALRIKLPFLDPNKYQQWIWIENHNSLSLSGNEFDQFQYEDAACVADAVPGLYMMLQIDKDIRSGPSTFGGYANYLKPLPADGFYDFIFESNNEQNNCVNGEYYYPIQKLSYNENSLSGSCDLEDPPYEQNDNNLVFSDTRSTMIQRVGTNLEKNLFRLGHSRNAFTLNGNKKIGIGTNPSTASMMSLVRSDNVQPLAQNYNQRKIYLNGVSVEILNQYSNGDIQVEVKFDDVDVVEDRRWCADEIVLSPVNTATGYSLNLKNGKTLKLDRSKTPTRISSPEIIDGYRYFNDPTLFRCTDNSYFHMETR